MQVSDTARPPSPGEEYIKVLWQGRWLFLMIVAVFIAGAFVVTALLTKSYSSVAILSVRVAPRLDPNVIPFSAPDALYPTSITSAPNLSSSLDEVGASRLVRRLQTVSLVTTAAREAHVIGPTESIDDQQVRLWVVVDAIERTDLVSITVKQPTAEGALRFTSALMAQALEINRAEATVNPTTRRLLEQELQRATSSMTQAEVAVTKAAGPTGALHGIEADRARLELSLAREQYSAVRRRLGMLDLTVVNQQIMLTVVDPPTLPLRPTFPRPLLNVSISLILGVIAATTFVSLRSVLRKT